MMAGAALASEAIKLFNRIVASRTAWIASKTMDICPGCKRHPEWFWCTFCQCCEQDCENELARLADDSKLGNLLTERRQQLYGIIEAGTEWGGDYCNACGDESRVQERGECHCYTAAYDAWQEKIAPILTEHAQSLKPCC